MWQYNWEFRFDFGNRQRNEYAIDEYNSVYCQIKWKRIERNDNKRSIGYRNNKNLFVQWHAKSNKLHSIYLAHNFHHFHWDQVVATTVKICLYFPLLLDRKYESPTQRINMTDMFAVNQQHTETNVNEEGNFIKIMANELTI